MEWADREWCSVCLCSEIHILAPWYNSYLLGPLLFLYILILCVRASWSTCATEDQRMWFHTEVQHGVIWCDLFFLVVPAHLKMCDTAKLEFTDITHEYLSCHWFGFLYSTPPNIAADRTSYGSGGVGRTKVNKDHILAKTSFQIRS